MSELLAEYGLIPLKTVVANPVATLTGATVTLAAGCYKVIVKPVGGGITIKIGAATTTITVGDGTWSPEIMFEPDATTSPTVKLIGANISCDFMAYFCSRICPTATIA